MIYVYDKYDLNDWVCLACGQYVIPWNLYVRFQGRASVVGT